MQKLIIIIITILLFSSCSTMQNSIKKNNKFTNQMIESLFSDNKNVFYIKSSYSTFSKVWSYQNNKIEIYNLVKGKVDSKSLYEANNYLNQVPKKEIFEVDKCMQLDGEIVGYKISLDNIKYSEDLPVDMKCFLNQDYETEFLNILVKDIKKHKLWIPK